MSTDGFAERLRAAVANTALSFVRSRPEANALAEAAKAVDGASRATRAVLGAIEDQVLPSLDEMIAMAAAMASDRKLPAPVRKRLKKIEASGQNLRAILNDVAGAPCAEAEPAVEGEIEVAVEAEIEAPAQTPAFAASAALTAMRPLRVLAAEANGVHQLMLRTQLAQIGINPEFVADKVEVIEAWQREPWDLILIDAQSPAIDGLGVARMIRSMETRFGWAYTPIIALAANAGAADRGAYAACGADGCVAKPVVAESLFAAIDQVLAAPARGELSEVA